MRYSADHKATTRIRLLKQAGALAKREGFANTGVDAMTAAAGLTAGAFYAHFGSKSEMLEALIEQELEASLAMFERAECVGLDQLVAGYLSLAHVEHPEAGCCLPALSAEIARAAEPARRTFERSVKKLQALLAERLGDSDRAWALLTQAVGAVMLARALPTRTTRKSLLDGVRRQILSAVNATTKPR
jgi:AcrR family transcriptional regulator